MALFESNRQTQRPICVLSNATNYIGLSKAEKKLLDLKSFNSSKPLIELLRGRKRQLGASDLQIAGSTVVLESMEMFKTTGWKISTGLFFDLKRTVADTAFITPSRARPHPGTANSAAFRRHIISSDPRKKAYRRSISVDPAEMLQTETPSQSSLAGKAVTYSARKDLAESYRCKRRDRTPMAPSRKAKPLPQKDQDSPTKAIYKRVLQRTLDQLERENFRGW